MDMRVDLFGGEWWGWLLGLAAAALFGGLIGGERESRGRAAGIRTQALVAVAAALLTATGKMGFPAEGVDFSRVASQVVSGVGFIGAGVILKHRGTVTGLTTAATLFLSAGVGVAVGAGLVIPAAMATLIALLLTFGLRVVRLPIGSNGVKTVQLDYVQGHGTFGPLIRAVQDAGGRLLDLQVEDEVTADGETLRHVTLQVSTGGDSAIENELDGLASRSEVQNLRISKH